jgi:uncharacterized membrane protein YozB (DUF420 family)
MIAIRDLPHVLAVINSLTVIVLLYGWSFIRRGQRDQHRRCMQVATVLGAAFLAIYLTYHANAGLAKFGGVGLIRPIYFTLLIIHLLTAAVAAVVVPATIIFALRGRFERHRPLARWAMPLWIFVSASGLVVYIMAVHLFPTVEHALSTGSLPWLS